MEPFVRRYNLDNRRFALVRTAAADRQASPPAARIDFSFHRIDGVLAGMGWGFGIGAAIVAPWFVIENTYSPRPMIMTLVDMGYAITACAVIGAVMGGI